MTHPPTFRPKLSLIAINLAAPRIRKHLKLIGMLAALVPVLFAILILFSVLGTEYPLRWRAITAQLNGMSFTFSLARATLPLICCAIWTVISAFLGVLIWQEAIRWQFSLLVLEGALILCLLYLICSLFYLLLDNKAIHLVVLALSLAIYLLSFFNYSNIGYYLQRRAQGHRLYGDILLELSIGLIFGVFVLATLIMSWRST